MTVQLAEKQIQDGWKVVRLGDIAENIVDRVQPQPGDERIFIGLEHIVSGSLHIKNWGSDTVLKTHAFRIKKGDILFSKRNTYLRRIAIAPHDCIGSADFIVIRPKDSGILLLDLLKFIMQAERFHDFAISNSAGSLSKRTKWKLLTEFKFPLPPLERQKEILEILEKMEEIDLKNQSLINKAETLFKVLLKFLVFERDEEGEYLPICDIARIVTSSVDKKSRENQQTVKLCNYVDVYNNREITEDIDFMVATASSREIERFSLKKGDVVITKDSETHDDIAVPAYVAEDIPNLVCGYHLAILKPTRRIDGKYLSYVLRSPRIRHGFIPYAQGITRFGLSSDAYKKVKIYCPEITKQIQAARVLDGIQTYIELLRKRSHRNTKKKLLILKEFLFSNKSNKLS